MFQKKHPSLYLPLSSLPFFSLLHPTPTPKPQSGRHATLPNITTSLIISALPSCTAPPLHIQVIWGCHNPWGFSPLKLTGKYSVSITLSVLWLRDLMFSEYEQQWTISVVSWLRTSERNAQNCDSHILFNEDLSAVQKQYYTEVQGNIWKIFLAEISHFLQNYIQDISTPELLHSIHLILM